MQNRDWHSGRADGLATIAAGHEESMYGPSSTVAFLRHVMPHQGSGSSTPTHHETRENHSNPDVRPRSSAPVAPVPDRMVSPDFANTLAGTIKDSKTKTIYRYEVQMEAWPYYL